MDCPVCREPMVVLELNKVEIDHCLECGGIWLDAGELELLLESAEERDKVLNSLEADRGAREAGRRCPICLKKMEKIMCGKEKKVLIDKCRNNDGIWFDRGELQEIIRQGNIDKRNVVLDMMKDMFGKG